MKDYTVVFLPSGKSISVTGGNLHQVMIHAGLHPDFPCGGNGTCGKCRVEIDGRTILACKTMIDRDLVVSMSTQAPKILDEGAYCAAKPDEKHAYVLALDVGTTTVAGAILDGFSGNTLAVCSCVNPQRAWGGDVITRIRYSLHENTDVLRTAIRNTLEEMSCQLSEKAGITTSQISLGCIVCNTAMHHLLLGIDPKPLVTPPYMPAVRDAMELPANGILPIGGTLRILPNIAGFIGADTAACLVAAEFAQEEELTLLLDIGTNGEMVLGNRERRIACSAAAGPAFEGAGISCGMGADTGAIDHVWLENGAVRHSVIGNAAAKGLCGSGLLDLAAVLLKQGFISPSGRMKGKNYTIPDTNVTLTQKDVRQLQLAKGAIRAGIELMAEHMGIQISSIKKVKLAGAFGNYLNPDSAVAVGMIPEELKDRIIPIGNAAFAGAKICALNDKRFEMSKQLARETEFLELASLPRFQDCFISSLNFP